MDCGPRDGLVERGYLYESLTQFVIIAGVVLHSLLGVDIEVECGQIVQPCKQAGQSASVHSTSPRLLIIYYHILSAQRWPQQLRQNVLFTYRYNFFMRKISEQSPVSKMAIQGNMLSMRQADEVNLVHVGHGMEYGKRYR